MQGAGRVVRSHDFSNDMMQQKMPAMLRRALVLFLLLIIAGGLQIFTYSSPRYFTCESVLRGYCVEPGWKTGLPFAWEHGSTVSASYSTSHDAAFIISMNVVILLVAFFLCVLTYGRLRSRLLKRMSNIKHLKTIKFAPALVPLIISGKKTSTWRLFDDKDLREGDNLSLVNKQTGEEFAHAVISKLYEKKLGEIEESDFDGHEQFGSNEEMLLTYKKYYGDKVNWETIVKIIAFSLR